MTIENALSAHFRLGQHKTAAALPPPLMNPETKYRHWYHGTMAEFYDPEHPDTPAEDEDPGGRLMPPDRYAAEYGQHADKHWNTDLGVHFTSLHDVAHTQFARSGGHAWSHSRVAHCALHLGNPKRYKSEFDMSHEAIEWAHSHGHHYLSAEALQDPDVEDHLDRGEDYSAVPGHDHLAYLDSMNRSKVRTLDAIDRHGPGYASGPEMDEYLAHHPDREEITEGFKRHLEEQGHDGVVYGNEYEHPRHHQCAIAFHPEQINMHRWEWLHESQRNRNTQTPAYEQNRHDPNQMALLNPSFFPGEGHHWVDHENRKLSLLGHFASAEPVWRQPKPEFDPEAGFEVNHQRKQSWTKEVRKALSRGDLKPEEAKAIGYHGLGHDQRDDPSFQTTHGLSWEPLPQTLYHVTTNKHAVLADGTLKGRDELGQRGGNGLGGGEDDTISFTDDPEVAHHIHRALHEYHGVLTGRITPKDLMEQAKAGGFEKHMVYSHGGPHPDSGEWQPGDPYPQGLQDNLDDMVTHHQTRTFAEAREEWGDGATSHPLSRLIKTKDGDLYTAWRVPVSGDERMHQRSEFYKHFAMWRGHVGGDMDPGFIGNDPKGLAACHPDEFGILRCHPKPGAQGYRVSALGEWRTADGSAVHVGGLEPSRRTTALRARGSLLKSAKTRSTYLDNPYRDDTDEWFHGTTGDYEGDPDPGKSFAAMEGPGQGHGGPQMNKLLGVHFTPLHAVAHQFAGPHNSIAHGRVFHARLKMSNPIHFDSEDSLLRHVWDTTARGPHFADETHDGNMQWNYGGGATREGLNARIDAVRRDPSRRDPLLHGAIESHLQFHPRQKEMAEAYVQHLRYEGYDGITYGNHVEGPRNHHCAIAFDPKSIEVTHVDQMHPSGAVHPAWPEETKRKATERRPGEVSHDHIASIHDEPQGLLDEVERYHNGGYTRDDPTRDFYARPDTSNTGRGEYRYHQASREPVKVYRGLYLSEEPETYEGEVRRRFDPREPIGSHWTTDPEVASAYAGGLLRRKYQGAGIVLHGEVDPKHIVPHDQVPTDAYALSPDAFEKEVYLHPGTPVKVHQTSVHWHHVEDGDGEYEPEEWWDHADEQHDPPLHVSASRHQHQATVLTDWKPTERLFSPTKQGVDPRLFDAERKMHPQVRDEVLDVVNSFFRRHGYGDLRGGWARVYLAGSQASEWWGNRDFDILVGINYPAFRSAHPDKAGLSDAQIGQEINADFRDDFNDEDWHPQFDPEEDWHRTGYVNKDSWDIRKIKPYAAYNITDDTWAVDPIDEPTGHQFDPSEWYYFEAFAEEARDALALPGPARKARASQVWEFVHSDRSRAFGPTGTGAFDRGNALEKYLDQAPSGIEGKSLMEALADARFGREAQA